MFSAAEIRHIKRHSASLRTSLFETNFSAQRDSAIMKLLAVLAVFVVLACTSASVLPAVYDGPTYELTTIEDAAYDEVPENLPPIRNRRVTCDLLSWQSKWLTINHSACAAKCLAQRRRGGRCRDGICICRK